MKKVLFAVVAFVFLSCVGGGAAEPPVGFSETTGDGVSVVTLAENVNTGHPEVDAEFGFSALIRKGDTQIIFDTGKAGHFLENAKKLNVDMGKINTMVLSHAHYDHCGGLMKYLETFGGPGRTLYVKDCFFEDAQNKYYDDIVGAKLDFTDGKPGYFNVGIDFTAEQLAARSLDIKYLDADAVEIAPGVTVYGSFVRVPLDPKMLLKMEDGRYVVDDFDEETAVAVETGKGLVIVTGCSHTGIVNIVNAIKERSGKNVYAVIGGFHLLDSSEKQIQDCIDLFKGLGIEHLGLSHCTGPLAKKMFLEQLPESSFVNASGSVFEMK